MGLLWVLSMGARKVDMSAFFYIRTVGVLVGSNESCVVGKADMAFYDGRADGVLVGFFVRCTVEVLVGRDDGIVVG